MSNRVMFLAATLGLSAALTVGNPAAAEVVYVNPAPGQYVPVTMPYTGAYVGTPATTAATTAAWTTAPSSWPWGWTTPSTLPWTVPGSVTPVYPSAPASGSPVYMPVTTSPVPVTTLPMVTGYVVAPPAQASGYPSYYAESVIALDRLIASAETADEIRILLSRADRLRQVRADNLTRTFLKERMVNAEVARASGLTQEYLGWMYDSLMENGDRLSPSLFLPNFRLLPPSSAASWTQVWSRSFAALYTSQAQATNRAALATVTRTATLRAEASNRGAGLQRLNAGAQVVVAGPAIQVQNSAWVQIRTANGFTGWINAADLSSSFAVTPYVPATSLTPHSHAPAAPQANYPYAGPESVILWQDSRRVPAGHDSAYGWIHPQHLQNAEAQYPAAASTSR